MMKRLVSILLLSLTLLPIAWNGINMLHYVVVHTHTFCVNYDDHTHQTITECTIFCTLDNHPSEHPISTQSDYQELKTYLTPGISFHSILPLFVQQVVFSEPSAWDDSYTQEVFQPPMS